MWRRWHMPPPPRLCRPGTAAHELAPASDWGGGSSGARVYHRVVRQCRRAHDVRRSRHGRRWTPFCVLHVSCETYTKRANPVGCTASRRHTIQGMFEGQGGSRNAFSLLDLQRVCRRSRPAPCRCRRVLARSFEAESMSRKTPPPRARNTRALMRRNKVEAPAIT